MRTIFILLSIILVSTIQSSAQVNAIPFTQSSDTFQFINGTVVDMPNEDDVFHANLPLGFTFNYNGHSSDKFGICTNGFIVIDSLNHSGLWILNANSKNQINGMMSDLRNSNPGGSIEYITVGSAPNRVCIVQWKDYGIFAVPYCHLNFQIRLFEGSNCIQFYYGVNDYSLMAGRNFHVGLTGDSTTDFKMRTCTSDWTLNSPALAYNAPGMFLNPLTTLPTGLVFSFGSCPASGVPFAYMTGNVYNDVNGNGTKDTGEPNLPNIIVNEALQNFYTTTDSAGNYAMLFIDSALNYSLHATPLMYWNITSTPTTYTVNPATQSCSGLNFGMQALPNIHDLSLVANYSSLPWPNGIVHFNATYHNQGTVVETGDSIICLKDSLYSFISSIPAPAAVNGDSIIWVYSNLQINEYRNIQLQMKADSTIQIGDSLHNYWSIQPIAGDSVTADNYYENHQPCLAAFDPNTKEVTPDGDIPPTQKFLYYTIYFQNTGTAPATNVFLFDTLDTNLDISSFELLGFSHPVGYQITSHSSLRFTFPNINLPDSNTNEPLSHGSVTYRMRVKPGLSVGTKIHNTAAIVFDYNSAIITNTTENIIVESIPNSFNDIGTKTNHLFKVYPNPASNLLEVLADNPYKNWQITLTGLNGEVVAEKKLSNTAQTTVDLTKLPNGIYFLQIENQGRREFRKIIKQ